MQKTNLPQEWETVFLTDIVTPKQWKTISTKELLDSGYIVYGANGKIGFYNEYTHKEPTIMITCRGATCGNLHISEPYSYINGNAMALDNLKEEYIDQKYLFNALKNIGFKDVITGSAQPQITRLSLGEYKLPLAPLSEQTHLATLLDELTTRVQKIQESLNRIPELLKTFRQSVLARAVSGELTEKWREENNYSAEQELSNLIEKERKYLSEKHKDSYEKILKEKEKLRLEKYDLTEVNIPKGWVMKPFFEFSLLNRGFDLPTSERIEGNYPILSSAGVIGFHNEYRVKGECVTVGRSGSVGQVFYTKQDCWVLNTALYVKDFGFSYPKFVFYKLKSMNLGQYAASTAVPTLNRNEFILELLKIPPYEEQQQIVHQVEHYFALADEIERQTKLAQEKVNYLTQSILTKAFRGELTANWRAANQAVISGENSAKALLQKIEAAMKMGKK